ncbi:MAG TPA: Dabb family protein [Blastocatellia bacterium]|nr:Dabb family protein [Blastocatellia bacterium]
MIKHVVFFKFKSEAAAAKRNAALDALRSLPEKIDVIRSFEVGEDLLHIARSWDAVLIATYDDLGALELYTRHDDHLEVVLKLREVCDAIGSVDYEY